MQLDRPINITTRLRDNRAGLLVFLPFAVVLIGLATLFGGKNFLFRQNDPVWSEMQNRGSWRIGVDPSFPPFEMLSDQGQPIGFDIDLAESIAAQWELETEIVSMGFDSLLDAVQTGQVDSIVSALPYDPRLTKDIIYSTPYFDAGIRLVIRNDEGQRFADLGLVEPVPESDLSQEVAQLLGGRKLGVEWGAMADMVGRRLQRHEPTIELEPFPSPLETINALIENPAIDAVLIDNVTLQQHKGTFPIEGIGPVLESNPYVIAVAIDSPILADQIDVALAQLRQSGHLEALAQMWFQ